VRRGQVEETGNSALVRCRIEATHAGPFLGVAATGRRFSCETIDFVKLTGIEIEHRGWEGLGRAGDEWRDRNRAGWKTLLPHFLTAIG